jgi:RNA polymerase sigma-70 factor, ECF subfamily
MSEVDERALVARALEGDRAAFGELVDAHGRVVYNLALRMCHDAEDARDVAQRVFLKAWEKLSTFDRRNRFFSWIYRIALNETLNFRTRRKRHEVLDEALPTPQPGPAEEYERREEHAVLEGAMQQLRDDDRQILILRHFLDLSHQEMGEILGVPEKTVKSRLHSARVRLESELRRRGMGRA